MTAAPPSPSVPDLGPEAAAVLAELPERMAHARAAPLYRLGLVLVALVSVSSLKTAGVDLAF